MNSWILCLFASIILAAPSASGPRTAVVADYDGIVSPVAFEFLNDSLRKAQELNAEVFILELDTPGGLDPSMRQMVKAILASPVPVVVYVYPSGARAASAGVFIAFAAHFSAMAPGTNIGAAHPIAIGSVPAVGKEKESDKTMESKMANDASAYLKSLAAQRGRNLSWAEAAVHYSTSTPATEAAALGVVDWVAKDLDELFRKMDGCKVPGMPGRVLHTKGLTLVRLDMSARQKFLSVISDPNVALMLMSLGGAGVLIELYSPGLILPGVVGIVALILGLYSFQTLSANYAGIILILAGFLMLFLEIKVVSYGLLALAGLGSVILGALMLFHSTDSLGMQVSTTTLGAMIVFLTATTVLVAWIVWKAQRQKSRTGVEGLLNEKGTVQKLLNPDGIVVIHGEHWQAESLEGPISEQTEVRVDHVEGLKLYVRKINHNQ